MTLPLNQIVHGDRLEVLRTFDSDSVDSIVTDPPYGLGTKDPSVEELIAYLQGISLDTGGDFMGKDWQIPPVSFWRECYRVLKPGGYVLCFAGTRTWDLLSLGIRAAGFENRDTIAEELGAPTFQWVHGQGFPKSMNIGKALIEMGLDPELCEEWEGWGTGLRPSWEPILCFRKPVKEKTVLAQVLATKTGAINIDGSRIKHANKQDFENHVKMVEAIKARGGKMANSWKNSSDLSGANDVTTAGRWPANLILVHSEHCRKLGVKKVQSQSPVYKSANKGGTHSEGWGMGARPEGVGIGHADEDGLETVESWDCVDGCAVRALDEQGGKFETRRPQKISVAEAGGPARYFGNFSYEVSDLEPFIYCAKASRGEKETASDEEGAHPTVKPLKLMQYLVKLVTRLGGVVLDPHAGSGSTCVAAILEGMDFIGVDIDSRFVKIAANRTIEVLQQREQERRQRMVYEMALTSDDEPMDLP